MTNDDIVLNNLTEHLKTIELVRDTLIKPVHSMGKILSKSLQGGGTIFWCGNGGSASDSQHLSAELVGRFKKNRSPLRSVALTTDTSALTCIANDFSYNDIFSRQVEALGRPGDVLVCISTSGRSENVINALKAATKIGMKTCALLGKGGGPAKELANHTITIASDTTARIQESHILIGHILCEIIEQELGFA